MPTGAQIKAARGLLGWTVRELGERAGVHWNTVSYIELGKSGGRPSTSGQPLGYYTNELRARGYEKAKCFLPHDGVTGYAVTGLRYQDHLNDAGLQVEVIKNQGQVQPCSALKRCGVSSRRCGSMSRRPRPGLGYYHERRDDARDTGLGPEHDFSSHAADAFGLMAVSYEEPSRTRDFNRKLTHPDLGII
jgi:phage terminase large subunit